MKRFKGLFLILFGLVVFSSCTEEDAVYPKPLSAMRLSFPEKDFSKMLKFCDYSFNIPHYTEVDTSKGKCNMNLNYLGFNATLYLTYIPIDTSLKYHIENSRKLVYDHSIKADAIEEKLIINSNNKVFGMAYRLVGNSASNYQFYVTDSSNHFLRGALYFNCKPNYDSLKPTIDFLAVDLDTLVNSLTWLETNNLAE
ncbi:MAG: gliding motility lipoprotein GldD [Crocinitomicaceae bacterium]